MAHSWDEPFIRAKYHLSVAKRLYENFSNFETKRFLSGTLTELAKAASMIVNVVLLYSHETKKTRIPVDPKARLRVFEKASEKMVGKELTSDVFTIFSIKRAQKESPVELLKGDKILLLDNGEYRALTKDRLKGLMDNLELYCKRFKDIEKGL